MTADKFLEKFREQFEDTDATTITLETKFREIPEWSSILALYTIAMVDDVFGKTLTGEDLRKSVFVSDIYKTFSEK